MSKNDVQSMKGSNDDKVEEQTKTVEDEKEKLEPGDTKEWTHDETGKTYTFLMPSALKYREYINQEKVGASSDGKSMQTDLSIMDPLIFSGEYVKPTPNEEELLPGELQALELAFYQFVKSIFR